MNIQFVLQGIVFEWDSEKASANIRKHGISFESACEAFFDPLVSYCDDEIVENESREMMIGMNTNWQLLYVVYVLRSDRIRIISARLVTKEEREAYES